VNAEGEKLNIQAVVENMPKVQAFVEGALLLTGVCERALLNIQLVVEEVFVNIASYAYTDAAGEAEVTVKVSDDGGYAELSFSDSGIPFDPLSVPAPDITLPSEKRKIGGLGIFLLREMAEDVRYRNEDGRNILSFKMKLS
jgi:anti-sigma regulatory factor (Ser/Thr protein kinase)